VKKLFDEKAEKTDLVIIFGKVMGIYLNLGTCTLNNSKVTFFLVFLYLQNVIAPLLPFMSSSGFQLIITL